MYIGKLRLKYLLEILNNIWRLIDITASNKLLQYNHQDHYLDGRLNTKYFKEHKKKVRKWS